MKAKMLLLALAVLGTTMVYSASPEKETKTDCEKKVLKQIKRKMSNVNFMDYVPSGQKARLLVTYVVNQNNIVEITGIEGAGEELEQLFVMSKLCGLKSLPGSGKTMVIPEILLRCVRGHRTVLLSLPTVYAVRGKSWIH